ncbi:MAG: hypothetical protein HZA20_06095 [Nitrospirae bacterium]|nr:hypothetical protein [Nitrospirota bacterium]
MQATLPLEAFEALEKSLGKEEAKKVVRSIETTITDLTEYRWKSSKDELLDAMRAEFVTRDLLERRNAELRADIIKWMFIFWCGQIGVIFALLKLAR